MNEQVNITLSLPPQAIGLLQAGLSKLPLEQSYQLFNHIAAEAERQLKEAEKAATKAKEEANVPEAG